MQKRVNKKDNILWEMILTKYLDMVINLDSTQKHRSEIKEWFMRHTCRSRVICISLTLNYP